MLTYNNQFEFELKKLIDEEKSRILEIISFGSSVEDFASYKQLVGRIAALQWVVEACDEVNATLAKR
jgi:hypothetical protein